MTRQGIDECIASIRDELVDMKVAVKALSDDCVRVHVPWLDALRATTLGALVLGQGFLWSDIVCYAVGVMLAAILDAVLAARRNRALTGA